MESVDYRCPICGAYKLFVLEDKDEQIYKHKGNNGDYYCEECGNVIGRIRKENAPKWEHIWDAPDGTFKGRCDKCGFVKIFIDGHDTQYKFCPQCGDRK